MSDGCTCRSCGKKYLVDINISNEVWDTINPNNTLLCGVCILTKIEALEVFNSFELIESNTKGRAFALDTGEGVIWVN